MEKGPERRSMAVSPDTHSASGPPLLVRLATPRGFCAGVERAIRVVEEALTTYGAPIYVRHEIVHNAHVVRRLEAMGAVFIDEIDEICDDRPVVFSAHGAPKAAHDEASRRSLTAIDATCPLVVKVHSQTRRYVEAGRHVFLVGHKGHPEVVGTMGQVRQGAVTLIETIDDVAAVTPPDDAPLSYVTQTTLSVGDTAEIVEALKKRFPEIAGPRKADICYATSNRQAAVKFIAPGVDLFVVIGSPQSSNSVRLVETARTSGSADALLVDDPAGVDLDIFSDIKTLGLSAGASAPENLVEDLLRRLAEQRSIRVETVETAHEDVVFKSPAMKLAS